MLHRPQAGSATLELVVAAPAVLALVGLVVMAGHVETAHQVVAQAAEDAARAATTARSDALANYAAHQAAGADLSGRDCATWSVALTGAIVPGGAISATVVCTTGLGVLPGHFTATNSATAVVDLYRGVSAGSGSSLGSSGVNQTGGAG